MFNMNGADDMPPRKQRGKPINKKQLILNIVGIALCVILLPILIMNCTLIIKGMAKPDEVPSLGKNIPLIVLTESMEPEINAGDLIICKKVDPQEIKEDDIIAFFDPSSNGSSIVTHKVKTVIKDNDGKTVSFETYGINNINLDGSIEIDRKKVPTDNVVGIYRGANIPLVGHVAMFMQSTVGLIICIFIPLAAFIAYDLIRRKKQDKSKDDDVEKLKAELAALKMAQAKAEQTQNPEEVHSPEDNSVNEEDK